jgi:hypothetical protein
LDVFISAIAYSPLCNLDDPLALVLRETLIAASSLEQADGAGLAFEGMQEGEDTFPQGINGWVKTHPYQPAMVVQHYPARATAGPVERGTPYLRIIDDAARGANRCPGEQMPSQ